MLNCVILQGRLTADPELRRTQNGTEVTSFTVAVNNAIENGAYFFDCVAWKSTATFLCNYFKKGQELCLTGELTYRDYETKDGAKRRRYEIRVDKVHFCGPKDQNTSRAATATAPDDFEEIAGKDELENLPF